MAASQLLIAVDNELNRKSEYNQDLKGDFMNYSESAVLIKDSENSGKEALLKALEKGVLNTIQLDHQVAAYMEALKEIRSGHAQAMQDAAANPSVEKIPDYMNLFKQKVGEKHGRGKSIAALKNHKMYKKFAEKAGMNADEDDELTVMETQSKRDFLCPITHKPFEEPMKGRGCSHCFSKEGILQWLGNNPERRCPVSGCSNIIRKQDLETDDDMLVEMKRRAKKRKRQEAQSVDDDEVQNSEDDDDAEEVG